MAVTKRLDLSHCPGCWFWDRIEGKRTFLITTHNEIWGCPTKLKKFPETTVPETVIKRVEVNEEDDNPKERLYPEGLDVMFKIDMVIAVISEHCGLLLAACIF